MKKILLASLAVFALAGAPAIAADMPVKAPPVVKKSFNWNACYVGIHGGYVSGKSEIDYGANTLGIAPGIAASGDLHPKGPEFGGTLGCDWSVGSNVVIGVLVDGAWTPMDDDKTEFLFPAFRIGIEQQWLATARARLGLDMGVWGLWYVTGGAAFTDIELSNFVPGGIITTSQTRNVVGWTAGWGTEYPLTDRLTLKTETLYMDFGRKGYLSPTNPISAAAYSDKQTQWVSKIGLNYRFDWGGPVVAKY
jgi:outer membrane immunogenic protein